MNKHVYCRFVPYVIAVMASILLAGFGGGKDSAAAEARLSAPNTIIQRSVRLNNYNNWLRPIPQESDYNIKLQRLSQMSNIVMNESYTKYAKLSASSVRALNPKAKIYRLYVLAVKSASDQDFPMQSGQASSCTSTTLKDDSASWKTNAYTNRYVWLMRGKGSDQVKKIASNTNNTLTLAPGETFSPVPDSTTKYSIIATSDPDNPGVQTPLITKTIDEHDWWLRDGKGKIVIEPGTGSMFLDVGKPGVKEAYLQTVLKRMRGQSFDGIVFDYWWYSAISSFIVSEGRQTPVRYPDDKTWFNNAWKPFISYVVAGVKAAGYKVIGNCAGEYNTTKHPMAAWQRTLISGTIYEQWAVYWDGSWLDSAIIADRMNSFQKDPLEAWTADYGLRDDDPEYAKKAQVGLAMYYIALPPSTAMQAKRSYHHYKDSTLFWEPLWDFNIGVPAGLAVKKTDAYFWSRKFTQGIVLLNYDSSKDATFQLDQQYHDQFDKSYSETVTLKPHTSLILAK